MRVNPAERKPQKRQTPAQSPVPKGHWTAPTGHAFANEGINKKIQDPSTQPSSDVQKFWNSIVPMAFALGMAFIVFCVLFAIGLKISFWIVGF